MKMQVPMEYSCKINRRNVAKCRLKVFPSLKSEDNNGRNLNSAGKFKSQVATKFVAAQTYCDSSKYFATFSTITCSKLVLLTNFLSDEPFLNHPQLWRLTVTLNLGSFSASLETNESVVVAT